MWRKVVIAVTMALGLLAPQGAFADDGYRAGGGDRTAGIGASRAEYRHRAAAVGGRAYRPAAYRPWRRFPVAPVAVATVAGAGIAYSAYRYGYGNYYANGYGYYPPYGYVGAVDAGDAGFGGCAIIHRPVPTAEGWVMQPIQVCN